MLISANLGFLFRELSLPEAIRHAHAKGFDAVECHWPYDTDAGAVSAALAETGMPMLGLNTVRGDAEAGDFGLAAIPGRETEARTAIDQAVGYAARIGCANVHVMAGRAEGKAAFDTFCANLAYAAEKAAPYGIGILIEPLNTRDAPGYFLTDVDRALEVIERTGSDSVRIMYDCYHMQIMRGDLLRTVARVLDRIGHIQFAAVPDRAEPDHGEVDFSWLLPEIAALGYRGWLGAEYRPVTGSLAWLDDLRRHGAA